MFKKYGHARSLNLIDSILIEDGLRDRANDGQLTHARAFFNKHYARIDLGIDDDSSELRETGQLNYVDQTDDGYAGLEAPLG